MSQEADPVAPALELDFGGGGRIYVKGDENTSFQEVIDEFNEQKEDMLQAVEDLKRMEYDLHDEYEGEDDETAGRTFG